MSTSTHRKNPHWLAELESSLPHILTLEEASATLRVSARTTRRLIARGSLVALRDVERVRVTRASVVAHLRGITG